MPNAGPTINVGADVTDASASISLRLHFSNGRGGAGVRECNATLGIDTVPVITAPLRERLRVDVCLDDQVTLSREFVEARLRELLPAVERIGKDLGIIREGFDAFVVFPGVPAHA